MATCSLARPVRLGLLAVGGWSGSIAVGAGTGYVIALAVLRDSAGDPWGALGAAIFGLLVGLLVTSGALVTATIVGVRRFVRPGRRLRAAVAMLAVPVLVVMSVGALSEIAGAAATRLLVAGVSGVVLVGGLLAVVAAAGGFEPERSPAPLDRPDELVD